MLFGEAANDWSCELFWGGGDTPMRDTPEARAGRGRLPNWGRALGAYLPTPSWAGPAPRRSATRARAGGGRRPNWGRALGAYLPPPSWAGPAAVLAPPPGLR